MTAEALVNVRLTTPAIYARSFGMSTLSFTSPDGVSENFGCQPHATVLQGCNLVFYAQGSPRRHGLQLARWPFLTKGAFEQKAVYAYSVFPQSFS